MDGSQCVSGRTHTHTRKHTGAKAAIRLIRTAVCFQSDWDFWVGKYSLFGAKGRWKIWNGGTVGERLHALPFSAIRMRRGEVVKQEPVLPLYGDLKERWGTKWDNYPDDYWLSLGVEPVVLLVVSCTSNQHHGSRWSLAHTWSRLVTPWRRRPDRSWSGGCKAEHRCTLTGFEKHEETDANGNLCREHRGPTVNGSTDVIQQLLKMFSMIFFCSSCNGS